MTSPNKCLDITVLIVTTLVNAIADILMFGFIKAKEEQGFVPMNSDIWIPVILGI